MRDGYKTNSYDTVINAYAVRAGRQMADLATWLNLTEEAAIWRRKAEDVHKALNEKNFNGNFFCDGICSQQDHVSFPANVWTLAFDIVDEDKRESVFRYVRGRSLFEPVNSSESSS